MSLSEITQSVLITGGAGFIGSNFAHHWCKNYPSDRIIVLDALTYAGNRQNIASLEPLENFRFMEGNICDRYNSNIPKINW